jgi:hypothetical protein
VVVGRVRWPFEKMEKCCACAEPDGEYAHDWMICAIWVKAVRAIPAQLPNGFPRPKGRAAICLAPYPHQFLETRLLLQITPPPRVHLREAAAVLRVRSEIVLQP